MRSLTVVFALWLSLGTTARADEWAKTFTLAKYPFGYLEQEHQTGARNVTLRLPEAAYG